MKLNIFLSVFSVVVLCTNIHESEVLIPKSFPLDLPYLPRKERLEIQSFSSRVYQIHPAETVSTQDMKILERLGFRPLLLIAFPALIFTREKLFTPSTFTWNKIFNSCRSFEPSIELHQLLDLFFGIESLDTLSRDEFFDFYLFVDFLRGGVSFELTERMKKIQLIFKDVSSSVISNSHLQFLGKSCIFTSAELKIDFSEGENVFTAEELQFVLDLIFFYYSNKSPCSELKKVEANFLYLGDSFYEMLKAHSTTLTSLVITNSHVKDSPQVITFPNIQEIVLEPENSCSLKSFEFVFHSRYTRLESDYWIKILPEPSNQQAIFKFGYFDKEIDSLLLFLLTNKSLQTLRVNDSTTDIGSHNELHSAIGSLSQLKSIEFYDPPPNIAQFFDLGNCIETVIFVEEGIDPVDWDAIGSTFKSLKNLSFGEFEIRDFDQFLEFLSTANSLESLVLPSVELFPEYFEQFFGIINSLSTLKYIEIGTYTSTNNPFTLCAKFEAFVVKHFEYHSNSICSKSLPFGPGIKYLFLESAYLISAEQAAQLKLKFPNLEVLFLGSGKLQCEIEEQFEFEVRCSNGQKTINFVHSLPHFIVDCISVEE